VGSCIDIFMKRIFLFLATNIAVMLVLGIVTSVLGLNRFMGPNGLNVTTLMAYSLVIGFTGAFISLLISKPMAKWSTGARVIEQPQSADEAWIVETVRKFADKAQIGMPEVATMKVSPMRLPRVPSKTLLWWPCLPACCAA
jgi:heat shock protein HtpX